jgi:hypothetical protein
MKNIKPFDQFFNEDINYDDYEHINEEFISIKMDNMVNFFKKKVVKKGEFADKAKRFNRSDFTKFVKSIVPQPKEQKNTKEFLKKLDKYIQGIWGVAGVVTIGYLYNTEFKELIDQFFTPTTGKVLYAITLLAMVFQNIVKSSLTNFTDVQIKIESELNKKDRVEIDFSFYYSVGIKNTYRILYNSFVRLLQKYENKDDFEIEWGRDSYYKNSKDGTLNKPPSGKQHIITTNFYPKEFIDLLYKTARKIYNDRVEYSKENNIKSTYKMENTIESKRIKFREDYSNNKDRIGDIEYDQRKNMTNVDFYIQKMSDKQILDLSKKIDNLELKFHEPIKYYKIK